MLAISLNTIVQRQENKVLVSELGEELVMMNLDSGNYISLNKLGSDIWGKIEQPTVVKDLIEYLFNKYNVTKEQCQAETFAFLEKMEEQNLLISSMP